MRTFQLEILYGKIEQGYVHNSAEQYKTRTESKSKADQEIAEPYDSNSYYLTFFKLDNTNLEAKILEN